MYINLSVTKLFVKILMIEMEAIILSFYKWELCTRGMRFDSNFTLLGSSSTDLIYFKSLVMPHVCFYQLYLLC